MRTRTTLALGALASAASIAFGIGGVEQEPVGDGAERADALCARLAGQPPADASDEQALLVEGFQSFLERLEDAFDGERATRLAELMHARADAVWSAFCLEGALRRSADADPTSVRSRQAYERADAVLTALEARADLGPADGLAVVHRRAILAAGFDDTAAERRALGGALALGGIDGAQISGLAALRDGDGRSAARLFGSLLDGQHSPDVLPWAVRGHGLGSLELLRSGTPD
ncbi:MAG: hypothetical protein AAGA20_19805 [Planctomycetota bacterium]